MNRQDEEVLTRIIYKTTNYDQFRLLEGNRIRKESDIKAFAKVLQHEGNLMDLFPIEVNEDMYVIDGQKRLGAAKLIGPAFINSSRSEHWLAFRKGDFTIKDFALTHKLLSQCQELFEESDLDKITRDFANAAYGFMRKPGYDHERMISQIRKHGTDFSHCSFQPEYLKEFEKIEQSV